MLRQVTILLLLFSFFILAQESEESFLIQGDDNHKAIAKEHLKDLE